MGKKILFGILAVGAVSVIAYLLGSKKSEDEDIEYPDCDYLCGEDDCECCRCESCPTKEDEEGENENE